jgi:CRP-like cAMP-binding protein
MPNLLDYCQGLPSRRFAAGDTLLAQGAVAGVLYVLVEGAVEIVRGDVQITTVSDPGAVFGELSALLGVPHTATVRALRDSLCHVAGDPAQFLRSHPDIAFEVARLLSRRLQMVTGYLADLKRQFADREDHFAMVDEVLDSLMHHQAAEAEPGSDRHPDPTVDSHAPPAG